MIQRQLMTAQAELRRATDSDPFGNLEGLILCRQVERGRKGSVQIFPCLLAAGRANAASSAIRTSQIADIGAESCVTLRIGSGAGQGKAGQQCGRQKATGSQGHGSTWDTESPARRGAGNIMYAGRTVSVRAVATPTGNRCKMNSVYTRILALGGAAALLALAASCGADISASGDARTSSLAPTARLDQNGSIGTVAASLSLVPQADAYALQASGLTGAKAIYGEVSYNPAVQHFDGSSTGQDGESLFIAVDDPAAGVVHVGWVLTNFDTKPGVSGVRELAQLSFANGAAPVVRRTSTPPKGPDDTFAIRQIGPNDDGIPNFEWDDTLAGDGNNDGQVSVQDLTPIGLQFNKTTSDAVKDSARDADYNKDGKVTVQDLANIGINFGASISGYAILRGDTSGSLSEIERINRADRFPAPSSIDGVLQWDYQGAEVTQTKFFNVQPFDKTGTLGDASTVVLQEDPGAPPQTITGVNSITFPGSDSWLQQGGDYVIIVTELAVDDVVGNAEPITNLVESLDLTAMVDILEDPGNPIDGTESCQWVVTEGGGLADVNNTAGTKGQASFNDRGRVVIEAHLSGDFTKKKDIAFRIFTIDSLALTSGGSGNPVAVNSGTAVDFTATGTFDWDSTVNGDEISRDLTPFVNWGMLPDGGNTGSFSLNTAAGSLSTGDANSGDSTQVFCEYPGTDEVTLFDNQRRSSDFLAISVN